MRRLLLRRRSRVLPYVVLLAVSFTTIFPIYWTVASSLKGNDELFSIPPTWFPLNLTSQHYETAITTLRFSDFLINSLVVALAGTAIAVVVAIPAAYGFARYRFPMSGVLFAALLGIRMFPPVILAIPLFLWMRDLGLIDTHLALVVAYLPAQLTLMIWMMESFFAEIPRDIEEAGAIDGLGRFARMTYLAVPLAMPGISVAALLGFLSAWNEMFFALILTRSLAAQTLPIGLSGNVGTFRVDWGGMAAFGTLYILPAVVFTLFAQRGLIRGLTAGAVKG